MATDDITMVHALIQHMSRKIEQMASLAISIDGQLLLEEMRICNQKLAQLITRSNLAFEPQIVRAPEVAPVTPSVSQAAPPVVSAAPLAAVQAPSLGAVEPAPVIQATPAPLTTVAAPKVVTVAAPITIANGKKNLFIIDDDHDVQKVLQYLLSRKSSFNIVSITDPLKAMDLIKNDPPDVVLMDLMMPGMSGLELLKKIRQTQQMGDIKIIIGSSKSFDKDRVEVLQAGANEFIAKPYNFSELLLRLNKLAS